MSNCALVLLVFAAMNVYGMWRVKGISTDREDVAEAVSYLFYGNLTLALLLGLWLGWMTYNLVLASAQPS
jgi:hypothetical protein